MGAIVLVTEIDPICALQAWWEIHHLCIMCAYVCVCDGTVVFNIISKEIWYCWSGTEMSTSCNTDVSPAISPFVLSQTLCHEYCCCGCCCWKCILQHLLAVVWFDRSDSEILFGYIERDTTRWLEVRFIQTERQVLAWSH